LKGDELFPAVQQVGKSTIFFFPGLGELLLADAVHGLVEIAFHVKVVENHEGIGGMLPDGRQEAPRPVTGNSSNFRGVVSAQGLEELVEDSLSPAILVPDDQPLVEVDHIGHVFMPFLPGNLVNAHG